MENKRLRYPDFLGDRFGGEFKARLRVKENRSPKKIEKDDNERVLILNTCYNVM